MKLNNLHKLLLKHLANSKHGLDYFSIWRFLKVNPATLIKTIQELADDHIVVYSENAIRLSQEGRKWILDNSQYLGQLDKYWREPLEIHLSGQIDINEPYAPRLSKLSHEIFNE